MRRRRVQDIELDGAGLRVPLDTIWVPARVVLEGSDLVWRADDGKVRVSQVLPGTGLLQSFLKLREAEARPILGFARRWGPLGFRLSDLPASRSFPWQGPIRKARGIADAVVRWPRGEYRESLEEWRRLATQAHSLLRIAGRLFGGTPGNDDDWMNVSPQLAESYPRDSRLSPELVGLEWSHLVFVLREWIAQGGVRPNVSERAGSLRLSLSGDRLLGALAVQLLFAASRRKGIYVCSECGKEFRPSRNPPANKRHFCARCRTGGAPERHAARAYYKRKKTKMHKT